MEGDDFGETIDGGDFCLPRRLLRLRLDYGLSRLCRAGCVPRARAKVGTRSRRRYSLSDMVLRRPARARAKLLHGEGGMARARP